MSPVPPRPSACVRTRFFAFSRNFLRGGRAKNENSLLNSLRRTTFVFRYVSDFFGYVVARRVRGPDGPTRQARNMTRRLFLAGHSREALDRSPEDLPDRNPSLPDRRSARSEGAARARLLGPFPGRRSPKTMAAIKRHKVFSSFRTIFVFRYVRFFSSKLISWLAVPVPIPAVWLRAILAQKT